MKLNKRYWLIILVVFLLATNITTVLTYRQHLNEEAILDQRRSELPESRIGPYLRDVLTLNEDQMDAFRTFRRTYNRSANALMFDMQSSRESMKDELNKRNPNREKLNNLANDLGEMHKKLKHLTFDYYFNMQSSLDDDQQDIMVEIFQAMLSDDGFAKTPNHSNHNHQIESKRGFNRGNAHSEPKDTSCCEPNRNKNVKIDSVNERDFKAFSE